MDRLNKVLRTLAIILGVIAVVFAIVGKIGFKEVQYTSGSYTGNIYISNFLQYKFATPSGCKVFDLEERAKQSGVSTVGKSESEIETELAKMREVIDLVAQMPSGAVAIVDANMNGFISEEKLESVTQGVMETAQKTGFVLQGTSEETVFVGKKANKFNCTKNVNGVIAKMECYVLATDGCCYTFMFTYTDEVVADKELLKNAFSPL